MISLYCKFTGGWAVWQWKNFDSQPVFDEVLRTGLLFWLTL